MGSHNFNLCFTTLLLQHAILEIIIILLKLISDNMSVLSKLTKIVYKTFVTGFQTYFMGADKLETVAILTKLYEKLSELFL